MTGLICENSFKLEANYRAEAYECGVFSDILLRYHRVKRKAEMRAAAKMAAGEDPQNEDDATETSEKADRLRAMVRIQLNISTGIKTVLNICGNGNIQPIIKNILLQVFFSTFCMDNLVEIHQYCWTDM